MSHALTYPPDNMAQQQLEDKCIKPVYLAVKSGNFPSPNAVRTWGRESRLLIQQRKSLLIREGVP